MLKRLKAKTVPKRMLKFTRYVVSYIAVAFDMFS